MYSKLSTVRRAGSSSSRRSGLVRTSPFVVGARLISSRRPVHNSSRNLAVPQLSASRSYPHLRIPCRHISSFPSPSPRSSSSSSSSSLRSFGFTTKRAFSSEAARRTALFEVHQQHGARMVPFGGWDMPLVYKDLSTLQSHAHTRTNASLFDVSHMQQMSITGKDRVAFMERLSVGDLKEMNPNEVKYSLMTNEKGGLVDDFIVTKLEDSFYVVVNAATAPKDLAHMREQMKKFGDVTLTTIDKALVALQGPRAVEMFQKVVDTSLDDFGTFTARSLTASGNVPLFVTRTGYTGEDGVEISLDNKHVINFVNKLLSVDPDVVKWAGLAARDTLRLEAGLCLYGSDIDETTTPIEASLLWTIGKRRRQEGGFLGSDVVLDQIKNSDSVTRKRVLFEGASGPPPRPHTEILENGKKVGEVTSGTLLDRPLGMAYISNDSFKNKDRSLVVSLRGKEYPIKVVKSLRKKQ